MDELAGGDALVDPLVRRVEAAGVADHADEAGLAAAPARPAARPPSVSASGISTWTCLPARIAATAWAACSWVGVHRMTASTSSRASTSSSSVVGVAAPYLRGDLAGPAPSRAADDGRDLDAVDAREGVEVLDAEGAGPGEGDLACVRRFLRGPIGGGGPQHEVADRGVGRGHVVEAVELRRRSSPSAPRMISHITSSMPSEPASRRYSRCGMSSAGASGRRSGGRGRRCRTRG